MVSIRNPFSFVSRFLFLRYSTPKYSASTTILIKNDQKGGISAELAAFEDLGIVGGSNKNIDNEIQILKSRKLIGDVVKKLNLNTTYFVEGRVIESEVYKRNSPILLNFIPDSLTNLSKIDTIINVKVLSNDKYELFNQEKNLIGSYNFNEIHKSQKLGSFRVLKNDFNSDSKIVSIKISTPNKTTDSYLNAISILSYK